MEFVGIIVSVVSAIGTVVCAYIAHKSYKNARGANENSIEIAKRQQAIDFHSVWEGVNQIDPQKPIGPDVVKAINALERTASVWNHDIVHKVIILDSYWTAFRTLYEAIHDCTTRVPGLNRTGRELLRESPTIEVAYESMKKASLQQVNTTTINGG